MSLVRFARICLITPGHLSTNPRLIKEADAFTHAGYGVSVIAADFALWARDADRVYEGRRWRVAGTLPFGPHAPRFTRGVQVLRQRSARLLAAIGAGNPAVVRAAWHPIAPELVAAAKRVTADLYVAHYPAALPAAAIAARRRGGLYAFDAEDFHLGDQLEGRTRWLVQAIESRYLPGCAYITAASGGIADAYVEAYGIKRPIVVLNAFPCAQAPVAPTPAGTAFPGPSIYWFSQTIGPDRGLESAVRALGYAQSQAHLYMRGTPARGFVDRLRAIAAESSVADRLHFLPPAAPPEMERLAASYDVGLVGETGHTPNRQIALTNKQFSYLLAGLPCVMSDIPAHRSFATQARAAVCLYAVDDAQSLAAALDTLLGNTAALAAARAAAWELGQKRFNWDIEKLAVLEEVKSLIEGRRKHGEVASRC